MANRYSGEREFHDQLYKERLGPRRRIMPIYQVSKKARSRFYSLVSQHIQNGMRVLDYGCGTGELSFYLAEKGAMVVGIDISSEAIRQAKVECSKRGLEGKAEFFVMDAHNTQFEDDSFDVA